MIHAKNVLDDRAMMLSPGRWPMWPMLPLKNRTRGKIAVLRVADSPAGMVCIAFDVNMWNIPPTTAWETRPVDGLIRDGWIVD